MLSSFDLLIRCEGSKRSNPEMYVKGVGYWLASYSGKECTFGSSNDLLDAVELAKKGLIKRIAQLLYANSDASNQVLVCSKGDLFFRLLSVEMHCLAGEYSFDLLLSPVERMLKKAGAPTPDECQAYQDLARRYSMLPYLYNVGTTQRNCKVMILSLIKIDKLAQWLPDIHLIGVIRPYISVGIGLNKSC